MPLVVTDIVMAVDMALGMMVVLLVNVGAGQASHALPRWPLLPLLARRPLLTADGTW
jgi:hypothetical protein